MRRPHSPRGHLARFHLTASCSTECVPSSSGRDDAYHTFWTGIRGSKNIARRCNPRNLPTLRPTTTFYSPLWRPWQASAAPFLTDLMPDSRRHPHILREQNDASDEYLNHNNFHLRKMPRSPHTDICTADPGPLFALRASLYIIRPLLRVDGLAARRSNTSDRPQYILKTLSDHDGYSSGVEATLPRPPPGIAYAVRYKIFLARWPRGLWEPQLSVPPRAG
ncbi:hypothetical protein C8Q77DRAFT_593160 [Trametes polyzona]|nr:hypothetical protein C8Q77DRAFT_593160 [Trametes polyzona]